MSNGLHRHCSDEYQIRKNKDKEVFVVTIAETIVDERTVVVEVFHTPAAKHAVEGSFRFYYFVVGTEIH